MDTTSTPTAPRARDADLAAASAHLKESWEHGKEAARDARQVAKTTWRDLSRDVDQYVEARPWTIVLGALGTGLAVGFLTGLVVSRAARTPPATG